MIRVTIEVDEYGHEFTIRREDDFRLPGVPASSVVSSLVLQAETAMNAALTAPPSSR